MDLTAIGRLGAAGYIKRVLNNWESELNAGLSGMSDDGTEFTGDILATQGTAEYGAGGLGTGGSNEVYRRTEGGVIITQRKIDITGMSAAGNTDGDAIGVSGDPCYIGRYVVATDGVVYRAQIACIELPVGGDVDIDLGIDTSGAIELDGAVGAFPLATASLAIGESANTFAPAFTANYYLYLTESGGAAAAYTAGQFIITTWGHANLD